MMKAAAVLLAVAAPAAAQDGALSFDTGKSLPLAGGQWSHIVTPTSSEARYGAQLSILCERATRTVTISRPALPAGSITIATDTASRTLPANGRLLASDPLLDAIAFSRGRFLVSGVTGPVLAVPNWPEAARAIEDCRN